LIAAKAIQSVLMGQSLSEQMPQSLEHLDDPRDSGLAQEIIYGVMRHFFQLQALSTRLLTRPLKRKDRDIEALILVGLYQILNLRVADHAAVHETAGAARRLGKPWAVGLINGVLRTFQRRQAALLKEIGGDPEVAYGLPGWLLEEVRRQWPEQWQERALSLSSRPPMSLRVNTAANSRNEYRQLLAEAGISAHAIPHVATGLTLEKALDVALLPGFEKGWVSVQDGAAQLAAPLLDLKPGQRVLDTCAAPGGKSGHILEWEPRLQLTAVDISSERLQRIEENLARLHLQAEVVVGDASRPQGFWAERRYDRVLLDVPCSATGVVRRHPDIKLLRRATDIGQLVKVQEKILKAIWPLLQAGGRLLYVTCSIVSEENEHQLQRFLEGQRDAHEFPLEADWGEARSVGRQIAPGENGMDGFFFACLVKQQS
jgi:16S rRNA (cytosine967-C5)-methyltransferase